MNNLMKFENKQVEVFELNGQILFNPYHVGECLDINEVTVRRHIQEMNEKQVIKLTNSDVHNMSAQNSTVHNVNFRNPDVNSIDFRKLHNTGENFLTESGVYKLIFKSRKPNAEKFQDWVTDEVLPSIRKNGGYGVPKVSFKEQVECIGLVADILRVNDASKLYMINTLYKEYSLPTTFLPQYVSNGNKEMKSATELLTRFNKPMSTKSFNTLLRANGYLEERVRRSTKNTDKVKKYNVLTDKGLKYGENLISPHSQREVQPMYYVDTFEELYKLVV